MCTMLLSINPVHVENILAGYKKFEFRKVKPTRNPDKILIYSTSPVMRVVAEATITEVLEDTPSKVWKKTKKYAGIDKIFFDRYYLEKTKAIAYRLDEVIQYDEPRPLTYYGIDFAPQSFVYI